MLLQVLKDVLCSGNYTYKRDFEGLFVFNRAVFVQLLNPHYDYDLYIYICIINIYIYMCVCVYYDSRILQKGCPKNPDPFVP